MVHHVALYKVRADLSEVTLEEMIRKSRSLLLKIPEALSVRSGRSIDHASEWPFFVAIDFETRAKQAIFRDDPIYLKYLEDVVKPYTTEIKLLDYELDPGKNTKYS